MSLLKWIKVTPPSPQPRTPGWHLLLEAKSGCIKIYDIDERRAMSCQECFLPLDLSGQVCRACIKQRAELVRTTQVYGECIIYPIDPAGQKPVIVTRRDCGNCVYGRQQRGEALGKNYADWQTSRQAPGMCETCMCFDKHELALECYHADRQDELEFCPQYHYDPDLWDCGYISCSNCFYYTTEPDGEDHCLANLPIRDDAQEETYPRHLVWEVKRHG